MQRTADRVAKTPEGTASNLDLPSKDLLGCRDKGRASHQGEFQVTLFLPQWVLPQKEKTFSWRLVRSPSGHEIDYNGGQGACKLILAEFQIFFGGACFAAFFVGKAAACGLALVGMAAR